MLRRQTHAHDSGAAPGRGSARQRPRRPARTEAAPPEPAAPVRHQGHRPPAAAGHGPAGGAAEETARQLQRERLSQAAQPLGSLAGAADAGLAREIAALRRLLDRIIAQLDRWQGDISLKDLDALSRIMGRLAALVTAHRRATGGAADQFTEHVLAALRAIGDELGMEL